MSGQAQFQVGRFVSPLIASTANSLLQDADPALFEVINFFQAVIQTHLGARFDAEVTKAGLSSLAGKMTTLAIPFDPAPFLTEAQLLPPLLSIFADTDKPEEETRTWYSLDEAWTLQWVLPTLSPAQYLQLSPMLRAVGKVVVDRIEIGFDPTYQSGAPFLPRAGLERLKVSKARYGGIQKPNTNLFFPCVEMDLNAFERRMPAPGQLGFTGSDTAESIVDPAGNVDLVDTASTVTP